MIKLEILELRTNQKDSELIDQKIRDFVKNFQSNNTSLFISVYRNELVKTDYSIHIKYDQKDRSQYRELLLDEINDVLGQFGMLYHSIWLNLYKINRGKLTQNNRSTNHEM